MYRSNSNNEVNKIKKCFFAFLEYQREKLKFLLDIERESDDTSENEENNDSLYEEPIESQNSHDILTDSEGDVPSTLYNPCSSGKRRPLMLKLKKIHAEENQAKKPKIQNDAEKKKTKWIILSKEIPDKKEPEKK